MIQFSEHKEYLFKQFLLLLSMVESDILFSNWAFVASAVNNYKCRQAYIYHHQCQNHSGKKKQDEHLQKTIQHRPVPLICKLNSCGEINTSDPLPSCRLPSACD
jgi:hypothetical protein